MSIIEKLGITPGPWKVVITGLEDIETTLIAAAPDLLEVLIEATIEIINTDQNEYRLSEEDAIRRNHGYISIIEKATGKTWEEIKELME